MAKLGYARCSSEEQARDSNALDYQAARLEEHCGVGNVIKDFTSASKVPLRRRPAFKEVVERLLCMPPDRPRILLVTRWDRLARRVEDIRYIRGLEAKGIQFQSLDSGVLSGGAMGEFTFTMQLAMAEYEADLISEKIAIRYEDRRAQRQPMNCPPWGYKLKKDKTADRVLLRLVPDPEHADNVAKVFQTFIKTGGVLGATLRECQFEGMPRSPKGLGIWLSNPVLLGHTVYNERRNKDGKLLGEAQTIYNTHEPLVSQELFDEVALLLEQRQPSSSAKAKDKTPTHPLTGLIRCPGCGYTVTFHTKIYECTGSAIGRYRRQKGEKKVHFAAYCRRTSVGNCPGVPKGTLGKEAIQSLLDETVRQLCEKSAALSNYVLPTTTEVSKEERMLQSQIEAMRRQDARLLAPAIKALEDQLEQIQVKRLGVEAQRSRFEKELQTLDLMPESFAELDYWKQNALLRRFVLQVIPAYQGNSPVIELRV